MIFTVAIALNSSEVSSTIISGLHVFLEKRQLKSFMDAAGIIQRNFHCCGFAGLYDEWQQAKIILYYDPV